jgi:hypothetical protein
LPQFNTETQNENTQQTVKLNQHGLPSNTSKKIDVTLKNKTIPALNLKGPTILQQQNVIHSVTSNSLPNTKNAANTKSRPAPVNPITPTFITGFGSQSFPKKMMSTISNTYPDLASQSIHIPKQDHQTHLHPSNINTPPIILIQGFGSQSFPKATQSGVNQSTPSHCNNNAQISQIDLTLERNTSPHCTQPNTLHRNNIEPSRRYNTRGVNLYNKFSDAVDHGQSSSANSPIGSKRKSQYAHIFENHVIEDESSESDSDNENDSDTQPYEDEIMTDDENSSIDSDEDEDGTVLFNSFNHLIKIFKSINCSS